MQNLQALLQSRIGHPAFRPGQEEIVQHVVEAGDALVVMPTGAGKSLCYQVPALALGGVAVVVSPLIALMKDQVEGLCARGVRATLINSTLSPEERRERLRELKEGAWELVFVAPERFTPHFMEALQQVDVRLFAIDEAHCLSQWGHDFRPDYLRLGQVRRELARIRPIRTIALTATATPEVQADILYTLDMDGCRRFIRGFDRTNLQMTVREVTSNKHKDATLPTLCDGVTLVYCSTRKSVERATTVLRAAGVAAGMYHAGLPIEDRSAVQDAFMSGDIPVVVATNAFGMGVDKSDVRSIVHYDLTGTVEAYYQEIGRAGRDGLNSKVTLLFREEDRRVQEFFIDGSHPPAEWVHKVWNHLDGLNENPVFLTLEALAVCLPKEAGDRAAASCLYVLQREGWIRRIHPAERPGIVRFTGACAETGGLRRRIYDHLRITGKASVGVWPDRVAEELELSREQVTAGLRGLEERGVLTYTAPERAGGVELLRPGEPLEIDEEAIRRRREQELMKLQRMVDYAYSGCRRRYILDYFGDTPPYERCGQCDACKAGRPLGRVSEPLSEEHRLVVRKILSCVARLRTPYAPPMVAKVLIGSNDEKLRSMGLDRLSTYGLLRDLTQSAVEGLIDELVRAGALNRQTMTRPIGGRERSYMTVSLTDIGNQLMRDAAHPFAMVWPVDRSASKVVTIEATPPRRSRAAEGRAQKTAGAAGSAAGASRGGRADGLLGVLQEVRRTIAAREDVPPYVVATNQTLDEMAEQRPTSRVAMLKLTGMGPKRFAAYGEEFIEAIQGISRNASISA